MRSYLISLIALCFYCTSIAAQNTFDGIACWGDSKTQGGQESPDVSYPSILQALLDSAGYNISVFNFGAHGEKSTEIMKRQGASPLIIQPFTIPASAEKEVKVSINSRLRVPEAGCNPCYVADIEGYLRHDWDDSSQKTFYFHRSKDGDSLAIDKPTQVITDAMLHHRNDVLVMDIGYNGGYSSIEDWISQYKQMVDYSECKEYIVIGRASHYYTTSSSYEEAFKEAFGNRYISLSNYYVEHGLLDAGIQPTSKDLVDIASQRPPSSLFYDEHHENNAGYRIKANLVFNKLKELGIITPVSTIIEEVKDINNISEKGAIYTLQGRKINKVNKSGIYIINRKKVYIKL